MTKTTVYYCQKLDQIQLKRIDPTGSVSATMLLINLNLQLYSIVFYEVLGSWNGCTWNTVHCTYFMYKAEIKPFTDIDIRLKILFSVSMIWNILFCVSMIWKLLFSDSYDTGMKDSVLSIHL